MRMLGTSSHIRLQLLDLLSSYSADVHALYYSCWVALSSWLTAYNFTYELPGMIYHQKLQVLLVVIVIIITIVVVLKQRKYKRKHWDVSCKNNKATAGVHAKADNSAVFVPMLHHNQNSLQEGVTESKDDNDADDGVYLIPEAPAGLAVNTTVVTTPNQSAYSRETTLNNTGCDDENEYLLPISTNTPKNQVNMNRSGNCFHLI